MAGRRDQRSLDQQVELGQAVLNARRGKVPWKVLEALYQRSRVQLHRYGLAARKMKQQSSR